MNAYESYHFIQNMNDLNLKLDGEIQLLSDLYTHMSNFNKKLFCVNPN